MIDTSTRLRREAVLPAGPAAAAVMLQPLLDALTDGARPVSLALDYGQAGAAGDAVVVEAWIDRATRTLVFAHGRLTRAADGVLIASGSAVFSREA